MRGVRLSALALLFLAVGCASVQRPARARQRDVVLDEGSGMGGSGLPPLQLEIFGQARAPSLSPSSGVTLGTSQTVTGAKTFSATIASTVASGSNAMTLLNGARIKWSDTNASAQCSYNSGQSEISCGVPINATSFELSTAGSGYQLTALASGQAATPSIKSAVDFEVGSGKALVVGRTDQTGSPGTGTTINQISGKAAISAGTTTFTITDSIAVAGSRPFTQLITKDTTCTALYATTGAGTITVTCNAAATGTTNFAFWLLE